MKCPTCPDDRLVMTERSGIEIDYCPTCRGVWLDRGELDKIIERSSGTSPTAPLPSPAPSAPRLDRFDDDGFAGGLGDDRYDDRDGGKRRPKKRRESLLSELFDF